MKMHCLSATLVSVFLSLLSPLAEADEVSEQCAIDTGRIEFALAYAIVDDDDDVEICTQTESGEFCDETKWSYVPLAQKVCDQENGQFVVFTGKSTCTDIGSEEPFVYERKGFYCYGESCDVDDIAELEIETDFVDRLHRTSLGLFSNKHDECTTELSERSGAAFGSLLVVAVSSILILITGGLFG